MEDVGDPGVGGHGTEMSGIALYGDLVPFLTGGGNVELAHRLESVKILPDRGGNDPELYGHITATAISRAEITAPERPRAICLAVTSEGDHWRGQPSSWSATLDDLTYGNGTDQRLIVVSAGNVLQSFPAAEYLDRNDVSPIESPAQAWNVLTVGACTEKCNITAREYAGWLPLGAAGDLSPPANPPQAAKRTLIRRYGYGVPDLARAIRSLSNDVTMVIEGTLQPYDASATEVKTKDMVLHDLPWPSEDLEGLGQTIVQMKTTLSYFIEPNPGERGWTLRHRYASHGLRFAVKRSEENRDAFRRRINRAAREENDRVSEAGEDIGWMFGPRLRNRGSLHSDIWEGTAADLAARHAIAVYPTGGWWREKPALKRADRQVRYALVVSLRAPVEVDLYTPIATTVGIPVEVEA